MGRLRFDPLIAWLVAALIGFLWLRYEFEGTSGLIRTVINGAIIFAVVWLIIRIGRWIAIRTGLWRPRL